MANNPRKFIGCVYLFEEKAVAGFDENKIVAQDPVSFAQKLSDSNVDEIIIFDLSKPSDDAAHEKALDIIKDICKAVDVPVTGAGNVKRMEDIKKLLYAGCKKAVLDYSLQTNIDITAEVSEKFGKDKILISYKDASSINENQEAVLKYSTGLIAIADDADKVESPIKDFPLTLLTNDFETSAVVELLSKKDFVSGITGNVISLFPDKVDELKAECVSKGVEICVLEPKFTWEQLKKNSDGMVPVIVQDYRTDEVLMLAYMNEEAYNKTLSTGKMTYYSRSRNQLWLKGETSSHFQFVKALYADCDLDTILAKVKQIGAACHTGSYSCFFNEIAKKDYVEKNPQKVLDSVFEVIEDRKVNPREGSYTNYLFDKGLDKILKKVGEEATEMVIAAKNPNSNEIVYEMSDFLYHMMVLMAQKGVTWEDVTDELARR